MFMRVQRSTFLEGFLTNAEINLWDTRNCGNRSTVWDVRISLLRVITGNTRSRRVLRELNLFVPPYDRSDCPQPILAELVARFNHFSTPLVLVLKRPRSTTSRPSGARDSEWMSGSAKAGTTAERHKCELRILASTGGARSSEARVRRTVFSLDKDLHGCRQPEAGKNGIPKCLRSQVAFATSSVCDRIALA